MRRRRIGLALAIAALAALAGCGGAEAGDGVASVGSGSASPGVSGSPAADDPDRARKFAQCMRDNGVPDFPDPNAEGQFVGTDGLDRDVLRSDTGRKALEACRDLAPNGGERPELDPAQQEQLKAWAQCMRDNGVDVPDPDPNGGGFLGLNEGIDPDDPTFEKAMEACQDRFTFRGQGSGL